jgi:nitroreductase
MSFLELARLRRSVRAYAPDAVSEAALLQVLEAGRLAPSACNNQPLSFYVLRGTEEVDRLRPAYRRGWPFTAPVLIVVCADHEQAWRRGDGKTYAAVDAAIALDHMILAAAELGLGTCWIAAFDEAAVRSALALPPHVEPIVMTPLGHPAEHPEPRARKSLDELVRWGTEQG